MTAIEINQIHAAISMAAKAAADILIAPPNGWAQMTPEGKKTLVANAIGEAARVELAKMVPTP